MALSVTSSNTSFKAEVSDLRYRGVKTPCFEITTDGKIKNGDAVLNVGASVALSGAGALSVTTATTRFTSTGANALTLPAGLWAGQRKRVTHQVDGGAGVITPVAVLNFTTATLTAVRDWVEFEWTGTAWFVCAYGGTATVAP